MSGLVAAIQADDFHRFQWILATEGLPSFPINYNLLVKALFYNRTSMAQLLIEYGCRVDPGNVIYRGKTSPLHLAIHNDCPYEFIESLLLKGAAVTRIDSRGDTALHLALDQSADDRIVDLLLSAHLTNSFRNETNESGLTYLHIAASSNVQFVRCLVERGKADINCQVNADAESLYAGFTPLHMAVEYGRYDVAKLLLEYGADLYAKDVVDSTPLHLALERRDQNFIELLFAYDRQRVNHVNRYGLSHFMAACACSDPSIANDFLDDLANSNTILNVNEMVNSSSMYSFKGYTPLLVAVEYECIDTVRLLLRNGARSTTTYQGIILTDVAKKNECYEIAQLIEMHEQQYEVLDVTSGFESNEYDFQMDCS